MLHVSSYKDEAMVPCAYLISKAPLNQHRIMLDCLKVENISTSYEPPYKLYEQQKRTLFLHTFSLSAVTKNEESNVNQNDELDNEKFLLKTASKSVLRVLPNNEILGFEADSLEVIPGLRSSSENNDLEKVFFKVTNNPKDNQLDFDYYLGPWETCLIRFKLLCEKIIDVSTIEKMNIKDWIRLYNDKSKLQ